MAILAPLVAVLLARAAGPVDVYFDDHDRVVFPAWLCGRWQFKYVPSSELGEDAQFFEPGFDDSSWKQIVVPSHWELEGFAEPKYGRALAEGTGLYRRHFKIGERSVFREGERVFVRFEGALYGLKLWVNGRFVGEWASAYNPVTFDVTDVVNREGEGDNVFAVQVSTRPKGWEFDTNDCWALSGLFREAHIFTKPHVWFADLATETKLLPDGGAQLRIVIKAGGSWTAPLRASGHMWSPRHEWKREFVFVMREDGTGEAILKIEDPDLWTAEEPNRYVLNLSMYGADRGSANLQEWVGLREITIDGPVLKLNGRPIKLRGVNHHDIWPDVGRAPSEEQIQHDLELMRAANINFIRTSHYPPHPKVLELCDWMGFYVMDEVPFGFGDEHLDDPSYGEILQTRARATVMRDKNHPSVIVWSVGNENPITDIGLAAGKRVKELDPTRPICFPQIGSYFARNYQRLPEWVDIYAPHYPDVATLQKYATTLTRPTIVTEYAHALGLATDRVEALWDIMAANPVFAGGAVWHFHDQGILRRAEARYDWLEEPNRVWASTRDYYDTNNLDGADGIVYADRTPQVDYFEVRRTYAPVWVPETGAAVPVGSSEVTFHVENRFDFRDLTKVSLEWALLQNGNEQASGSRHLNAPARQTETIALPVEVPTGSEGDLWAVALRFVDEDGVQLFERMLRLDVSGKTDWLAQLRAAAGDAAVMIRKEDWGTFVDHSRFSARAERNSFGSFWIMAPGAERGSVYFAGDHFARPLTMAEELRSKATPLWDRPQGLGMIEDPVLERVGDSVRVQFRYSGYTSADQNSDMGGYSALVRPDGTIDVSYDFAPLDRTSKVLEAGFAIKVVGATEFRWIGQGPYAGYPGKERLNDFGLHHLNREDLYFQGNRRGVEVAVITRPDGTGIAIVGDGMDIAVQCEPYDRNVIRVCHNALVSGLGNKGVRPEVEIDASQVERVAGSFTVIPLMGDWPEPLLWWFGPPRQPAPTIMRPFVESYDQ